MLASLQLHHTDLRYRAMKRQQTAWAVVRPSRTFATTQLLSLPLQRKNNMVENVLVAFADESHARAQCVEQSTDEAPAHVQRMKVEDCMHLADLMRVPVLVVLSGHCDTHTERHVWKVHGYWPATARM